jgi:hypothetical protein
MTSEVRKVGTTVTEEEQPFKPMSSNPNDRFSSTFTIQAQLSHHHHHKKK